MNITDSRIDSGKPFDWGRVSADYARFRDIYPDTFYNKLAERGLCISGQRVLDIGTGTGVLPRNMYGCGADWTGIDISENQIEQARTLARNAGMDIDFAVSGAEDIAFPEQSFDVVTACQCFWYFNYDIVMPRIANVLKDGGRLVILCMEWLPFEDDIAGQSEQLVLKYSPEWSGGGAERKPIWIPDIAYRYFELADHEEYDIPVHFTRESWHGRMKSCRGIGASLSESEIEMWEKEHRALLNKIAPEEFDVLHYAALAVLKKKGA